MHHRRTQPLERAVHRLPLVRRTLRPQHCEAELQRAELRGRQSHGTPEWGARERHAVTREVDLHARHEPARVVIARDQGLEIAHERLTVGTNGASQVSDAMLVAIREMRDEQQDAPEARGGCLTHR